MYFGYSGIFSSLSAYLKEFSEHGYNEESARKIKEIINEQENTPLKRIFSVFDCDEYDRCALILSLVVSSSASSSHIVSEMFSLREGYITPSVVSSIFFGIDDIIPFYINLTSDSPLDRLLEGVSADHGSLMSVKGFISVFVFTGIINDDCFEVYIDNKKRYLPQRDSERAQREIVSFLKNTDPALPFVLQITGERGCGKHTAIRRSFSVAGFDYVFITLPAEISDIRITEISSKLLILGAVPVLNTENSNSDLIKYIRLLADETGLCALINEKEISADDLSLPVFSVRLKRPLPGEQYMIWQELTKSLPVEEGTDLSELIGEFDMTSGDIERAISFAVMLSDGSRLTLEKIKNGCYRSFASDMGDKAVHLDAVFGWDDIILPERSKSMLAQACSQVRLRHRVYSGWGFSEKLPYGRGVSMIFTGPPGTGKTMGAQVMAKELGMDIYRVSLANVVSKYIGETEKNLNEIFEKAKSCRVILFFDEADVLFSKRTEVKDSNDKYSNMESAFLLQKMEEYSGVVILATNFVQNFDEAFKRRMSYIVEFPFPDASCRRMLWKKSFPEKTPLGDIDMEFLVEQYELSGSNIKNIALHSAFLAAEENSNAVEMKHILRSVRNEYSKSGKAFTKAEAGEYCYLLDDN